MDLPRRTFLHLAAGVAGLPAATRDAGAETYPSRPVRLIVGAVPGSAPDVIARLIAQSLAERLGQSFVVDNRSGASGNLATEAVARAVPDGYTLLLMSAGNAINTSLYETLNFDLIRDIAPVAGVVSFPMVITVRSPFPANTLAELIAYANAKPGKINIGTPPIGSPQHVAGELFKMLTGTNIVLVAYRGGPPAITDALGGQIDGVIGTDRFHPLRKAACSGGDGGIRAPTGYSDRERDRAGFRGEPMDRHRRAGKNASGDH